MTTRRTFLKQTSLAGTGILLSSGDWFKRDKTIGLQLYTMRNEIGKDGLEKVIAQVAATGYNTVEVFGYGGGKFFGKTPAEFVSLLQSHNMRSPSGHYMMIDFLRKGDEKDMKDSIETAAKMGHSYIVIPFLFDDMRKSLDDYKKLAAQMNIAAAEAKKSGLKLLYHNHNFEFKDWGAGQTGFSVLQKETDPSLVGFEADFYWIVRAGLNPKQFIKENRGRIKQWHVKDMAGKHTPSVSLEGEQYFTEVGTGIIDYKEIFEQKKQSGMEYFYVEQDQIKMPVYESIAKSYNNVKKIAR